MATSWQVAVEQVFVSRNAASRTSSWGRRAAPRSAPSSPWICRSSNTPRQIKQGLVGSSRARRTGTATW